MCDETGPPTQADEDWYWARVAIAQDVPPARNKQPEPMEGQATLESYCPKCGTDLLSVTGVSTFEVQCRECGTWVKRP